MYVFAQLKPLAVVVEDALAHTLWQAQHMATVHYENGRYHLHAELKDISDKENKTSQQKTPSSGKTIESTAQELPQFSFNFETNSPLIPVIFSQSRDLLPGHTQINSPPPKA